MQRRAFCSLVALAALAAAHGARAQGAAAAEQPAAVVVVNPDLAGLLAVPGGGLLAWGSDASVWRHDAATATAFGTAVWRPASTPHHGRIRDVALSAAPGSAARRLVAVGDDGLLLLSDDDGAQWRAASLPGPVPDLLAVACARARCLAVGPDNTLLASADGGAHWQHDASPTRPTGPLTTTALAADGTAWVASARGRLWQQRAEGQAWQERPLPPAQDASRSAIDALAVDNAGPTQLLVARADGLLLGLLAAGGEARRSHRFARGTATRLAPLPAAGAWVATGSEGACASRGGPGQAWRSCQPAARRLLRGLASSPDGRHWVLVGEAGLLLQGRPPQRPWQPVVLPDLPERADIEAVIWSEARQGFVAVGPSGLVLHGEADGRRWTVTHSAPRHYVNDVRATRGGGLLAALNHRTLARSDDGGRHWRSHRFTALHEPAFLNALHADARHGGLVVAGGQGSVMVAPDGRHWRHHSSGHGRDFFGLLPHPSEPEVLLYGSGGELLRVHTEAAAWHPVKLPTAEPIYHGFRGPGGEPWLVGGGTGDNPAGVVLRGSTDGQQWALQPIGRAALRTGAATPDGRAILLAGDRGAVYRAELPTSQAGEAGSSPQPAPQWQTVAAPLADWSWLQTDAAGQALWLGGSAGALARSSDGGLSWERVAVPTESTLRRPSWDARRRAWWMPGRDGTLLRSDDDGRSWRRVFTHTRAHLKGVWIDPRSGALLLYGARLVHLVPGDSP